MHPPPRRGWRLLLLFWAGLLIAGGGGAGLLQVLGSPGPAPRPESASARLPTPAMPVTTADFDHSDPRPRLGFILSGIGLDRALSQRAAELLPPGIDFARSAYAPAGNADAPTLASWRGQGHECLLSIPMEPAGEPASDEGDHALLTGAEAAQNSRNLDWALARATGCAGATGASDGMTGQRYAASPTAMEAVLGAVGRQGLFYVDPRPEQQPPPGTGNTRFLAVDAVVDAPASLGDAASAAQIDAALAALEKRAAMRGQAIGLAGPPRPVLIERLAIWSRGLAARGIALAPVSALRAQGGHGA